MVSDQFPPGPPIRLSGSTDSFSVQFQRDGARNVVTVAGDLDVATAPQLEGVLRGLCGPLDGDLEVDAAELSFCDCRGLAVLLRAAERRRRRGRRLIITHPSPALRRLVDLTGAADVLRITGGPSP